MKKYYTFLLLIFFVITAYSQNSPIRINENSIVKDSAGNVYPFNIWQALIFKADYTLKPVDPQNKNTEFLLIELTDKQKNEILERMPKPRESPYFSTGKKISLFKSTDINNKKINLKDEKGKIIVLNFWFINCAPCRMEMPDLNDLVEKYKGNDSVLFIAVALDTRSDIKDFLKKMPFNYTIIHEGRYLSDKYGIKSYPTHVIVDTEGKVYFHTSGLATNTVFWLKKTIDEILTTGKSPKN